MLFRSSVAQPSATARIYSCSATAAAQNSAMTTKNSARFGCIRRRSFLFICDLPSRRPARAVRFLRFVYYTKFTPYSQLDFPPFHRKNPSQRRASEKKVYNAPVLCYTTCRVVRRRVVCLTVFPPRGGASPVEHESRHRDRKSTRLNSSHRSQSRMPSSA